MLLNLGLKNLDYYIQEEQNKDKKFKKSFNRFKRKIKFKKLSKSYRMLWYIKYTRKDPVAGMSVTVNGKADNKRYRHFKIRSKESPDDF